jgi:hypothetical protein
VGFAEEFAQADPALGRQAGPALIAESPARDQEPEQRLGWELLRLAAGYRRIALLEA